MAWTLAASLALWALSAGAEPNLDGLWQGTTSQGQEISFRIAAGAMLSIQIDWVIQADTCEAGGTARSSFCANCAQVPLVSGGELRVSAGSGDLSYTLSGEFLSPTEAAGTAEFTYASSDCGGEALVTWSAARQGGEAASAEGTATLAKGVSWGVIKALLLP
ncbi:MAG: hypothetical protein HYW07_16890 [Candidatus Latescibacteria bacterium]|nr:hypothetical protein [Candidatus Latescibacterota bacterium]